MRKKMISITFVSLIGLLASGAVCRFTGNRAFFPAAVTFGTMFYHLAARLAVGFLIDAKYHNQMDYTKKWFREKAFERKLYRALRVKKWKKWLPTFTPGEFDMKSRGVKQIVGATCQAEVVHELNLVLSFVPVVFSVWFGSLGVFLITSFAAFCFDGIFVIMQRYNRPRLIRLLRS